jgi:hypothetical protein
MFKHQTLLSSEIFTSTNSKLKEFFLSIWVMFLQHILHCPINVFGRYSFGKCIFLDHEHREIRNQSIGQHQKFSNNLSTDFYINRKAIL